MPTINGTSIAEKILSELKSRPAPRGFLAVFLAGSNPSSLSFVKIKEKTARRLGVDFRLYKFPASITQDNLRAEIGKIAGHKTCGGVIIQLPLPEHINRHYVLNAIPREKDVDVLGERALGAFFVDRSVVLPPGVAAAKEILSSLNLELEKLSVGIIGAGLLIGKPSSAWLGGRVKNLAVFQKNSGDVSKQIKTFDLIISGAGKARLFGAEDLKRGAVVIDFGYDEIEGKMSGDFDPRRAEDFEISYTPTPGGTGPVLVAKLFENFYTLSAERDPRIKR